MQIYIANNMFNTLPITNIIYKRCVTAADVSGVVRLCKTLRKWCTKFHQNRLNFTGDITKKHFGLSLSGHTVHMLYYTT